MCRPTSRPGARSYSRGGGYDWTPRFAALASALTDLPANNIVLDGEVIVEGDTGVGDFDALQADLASGRSERMVYFAFDLLLASREQVTTTAECVVVACVAGSCG